MKRSTLLLSIFVVPLVLFSCDFLTETPPAQEPAAMEEALPPPPEVNEEDLVTKNVTYTGILEEGGVTIYQEGSHRLMLSDGKMVLLKTSEDSDVALALYIGKLVRVKGDVMPTVEAGGTIMEAKEIHLIRRETDAEGNEHEVLRVLCGGVLRPGSRSGPEPSGPKAGQAGNAGCPENLVCEIQEDGMGVCMEELVGGSASLESSSSAESSESSSDSSVSSTSSSVSSSVSPPSSVTSASSSSSTSASVSSSVSSSAGSMGSGYEKAVELMLGEDYAPARWTQEYCTSHAGFCVPVHKNWYYKSFGALSSVLWHVEMGALDVENMGDGPIAVELKSGDVASIGVADGDVKIVGGRVIGYRSFSDSRHFEISAVESLRVPVEYVAKSLSLITVE